jgi:hypothetical protein
LALDHHVLAKDPLEGKSAPVAQFLEDIARHQVHRLGRRWSALQPGRKHHVADLDDSVGRVHAHKACVSSRNRRRRRQNGKETRGSTRLFRSQSSRQILCTGVRAIAKPGPDLIVAIHRIPKIVCMLGCGERFERNPAPGAGYWSGQRNGLPVSEVGS